jgi:aspartate kinase
MLVQKFGGTSLASLARIQHAARLVASAFQKEPVCVVVSAMAGETNRLSSLIINLLGDIPSSFEADRILSSGELVSASLLALSLEKLGLKARSFNAFELPIYTKGKPTHASIESINTEPLRMCFSQKIIPVVTGFQGLDADTKRITTIGRGGSDTTAVALAHALRAKRCDIYTDIDGVYAMDPHVHPDATRMDSVSYNDMLALAEKGAKVLQKESVLYAMEKHVPLRVLSTFYDVPGTDIAHYGEKKYVTQR